MDRPKLKVADVLRRYGEAYREQRAASLSPTQRRVMSAIEHRTVPDCRSRQSPGILRSMDQCPYERT